MSYNRYHDLKEPGTAVSSRRTGVKCITVFLLLFVAFSATTVAQDASDDNTDNENAQTETAEEQQGSAQDNGDESKSFLQKIFPSLGGGGGSDSDSESEGQGNPYADYNLRELNDAFLEQARQQNIQEMMELLRQGARINAENDHGRNALIEASRLGHIEVVKTLIKYNATLNAKDNYDGTALEYAEKEGHIEIVHLLQKNGARR